jgi:hypothetical protein
VGVGVGVEVGLGRGVALGAGVAVGAGFGVAVAGFGVAVTTTLVTAGVLVAFFPPPKTLLLARSTPTITPTIRRTRITGRIHFRHGFGSSGSVLSVLISTYRPVH